MKRIISILIISLRIALIIAIPIFIIGAIFIWSNYKKELALAMSIRDQGEVNYLIIFQNTLELRPTGGYIGNFAEVTLDKGKIKDYTIYNTNLFDYGKPSIEAPEIYKSMLGVDRMQLRDSNWSPDFPTTAKQILDLYKLEGGTKDISGVIAINASILPEMLRILGPVSIGAINKELTPDNVLLELQYELNFGYAEKGISKDARKEPIKDLAFELDTRIDKASIPKLYKLGNMIFDQASQKQIIFWSQDDNVQSKIFDLGWDGAIDVSTTNDYFKLVDANLGALKTDYYMQRSIKKEVRECGDKICSQIKIIYTNTAKTATPLNNDYKSYTRVLLPKEAFINTITGVEKRPKEIDYSTAYNKKIAGFQIVIPFNTSKEIVIDYTMPKLTKYNLDIQKQSGIKGFDFSLDNQIDNKKVNEFIKSDWSLKN